MRCVVQRVLEASVAVGGQSVGTIGPGLLVYLGIARTDTAKEAAYCAEKLVHLRIFEDEVGRMNRSLLDVAGEVLVISQFTLYGDVRRGRRPSFNEAAPPEIAEPLYRGFLAAVERLYRQPQSGVFRAEMHVASTNDGPVTILINTED